MKLLGLKEKLAGEQYHCSCSFKITFITNIFVCKITMLLEPNYPNKRYLTLVLECKELQDEALV